MKGPMYFNPRQSNAILVFFMKDHNWTETLTPPHPTPPQKHTTRIPVYPTCIYRGSISMLNGISTQKDHAAPKQAYPEMWV